MNEDQSGSALAGYLPQEVHVRPDLGLRVARHPDFFLDLIIVGPQVRNRRSASRSFAPGGRALADFSRNRGPAAFNGRRLSCNLSWVIDARVSRCSLIRLDDDSFEGRLACRQFTCSIGKSVARQNVGDDLRITLGPKAPGPTNRHLTRCKCKQCGDRLIFPAVHEQFASKFGSVAISLKQTTMAGSA
jgi:hypothetical protein